jgi:DNA-binding transcriptional MocR family regulator
MHIIYIYWQIDGKDESMTATSWTPAITKADGPINLTIANSLAADILSGRLPAGTRLPPQRTLADLLGIEFTTVSRAYTETRRRGLVEGRVGQGTYPRRPHRSSVVRHRASHRPAASGAPTGDAELILDGRGIAVPSGGRADVARPAALPLHWSLREQGRFRPQRIVRRD